MSTIHDATVKYPPKEWEGKFGPYLQMKVTLHTTGEDVSVYCSDTSNQIFLGLRKGQHLKVREEIINGKVKYQPSFDVTHTCSNVAPRMISPPPRSPIPLSDRLNQILDCFSEVLIQVESRFPNRDSKDQIAIAHGVLAQLRNEYGENVSFSPVMSDKESEPEPESEQPMSYKVPQPPSPVVKECEESSVHDPNDSPWKQWKKPDDAIIWAQGELPDWDIDALQEAFNELPVGYDGKKAQKWANWVKRRKESDIFF